MWSFRGDVRVSAQEKTPEPKAAVDEFSKEVTPFLKKYCYRCHGPKRQEEGLELHKFTSTESMLAGRKKWESIFEMIELEAMPPEDAKPKPTAAERKQVLEWLEGKLFHLDCTGPRDPGRVTIRRLNRAEYNNTVRDLLGVDFRPADDFPSDDVGYGFDNIGDVLTVSPLLMEKYLDAAEEVAAATIAVVPAPRTVRYEGRDLGKSGSADRRGGIYGLPSRGSVFKNYKFPVDGEYVIRIRAGGRIAKNVGPQMEVQLDGKKQKVFEVKADRRRMQPYELRLPVKAGGHKIEALFINDYYNAEKGEDRNLYIGRFEIEGPFEAKLGELPESHKRLITAVPDIKQSPFEAARKVLRPFISRAFRRPAKPEEVDRYAKFVEQTIKQGESYEQGMRIAVAAALVSPHFLFRVEADRRPDDASRERKLNDYELASRLSYFLWSSMPDEELFELAAKFQLHKPDVLEKQIRRMLKDSKSQALVENFASQWLNLRSLDEVTPDPKQFPDFDERLRSDMRTETKLFFQAIMREDRSMLDLLDARFTFLNERLAKHYGIEGVKGDEFRRVDLSGVPRAGVLTHASVLTLTSNPTRTSPVKRGKWVLENILGTPPPEPPANVPELEAAQKAKPDATLREQLELHRQNPTCKSCHETMDSIGFGFENFDALGRWRDRAGSNTIDASGVLPGGGKFSGPLELVRVLKKNKRQISRSVVEKMLTYALGRGLEYYDKCTVEEIAEAHAKAGYKFSALVLEIVKSEPFLRRRGDGERK
jgi:hypothetical protein